MNTPPCLLTVPEAAAVLRMDQRALIRSAKHGAIPGAVSLPTGDLRFDAERLYAWARGREREGGVP